LLTSLYWDNFIYFGMGPKKGPDGKLAITFPIDDKKLPGIAAEDIGKCAYGIFKKGDEFIGKRLAISGENLTGAQIAAVFTEVLGHEVRYNSVLRHTVVSDLRVPTPWATNFNSCGTSKTTSPVCATRTLPVA